MKFFLSAVFSMLLATFAFLPSVSLAGNWYVGGGVGQSKSAFDVSGVQEMLQSYPGFSTSFVMDETATGKKVFGGYRINRYVAVEGQYADFGKFTSSFSASKGSQKALSTGEWSATGLGVSMMGILPIGSKVSLFGKVGMLRWNATTSYAYVDNISPESFSGSDDATGTSSMLGVGINVKVAKKLSVRVEHERVNDVGDEYVTGKTDISLTTANLVFNF